MMMIKYMLAALCLICVTSCGNKYKTITKTDANGFRYQTVTNDPYNLRIYTLDNGLKAYLSVNTKEPRIQTYIPIKVGASYDPSDNTGLAHYLEHLMFKGSSRLGTINWEAEKPLIDSIEKLYELHKFEPSDKGKKAIYRKIDSISAIAAKYASPNEFDKLMANIGAINTNAYTTTEATVYENDIPSNELERWLKIESERLTDMQMRLFHTELETVYEEFNENQDYDDLKAYHALLAKLYPTHPYGQHTILGKAEHLKNPSLTNIRTFYNDYYVPNNMAICLSGDINPEETICLINKYFGHAKAKNIVTRNAVKEQPIDRNTDTTIYGPQAESLILGYRFDGVGSDDIKYLTLINFMLHNSQAGLIDIDLLQKQKILSVFSELEINNDYSTIYFYATPKQGQTLESVRDLILQEIEKIKNSNFDDWLIEACINNLKLDEIRNRTLRDATADNFVTAFTQNVKWEDNLRFNDELAEIKKDDVVNFAKSKFKHYAVVYKRTGIDSCAVKMEKPQITPITSKRDTMSDFAREVMNIKSASAKPHFIDFSTAFNTQKLYDSVNFSYIENNRTPLFELYYIFEMGRDNNLLLDLAAGYLPLIGTDKYTADELQQEIFKLGLCFNIETGRHRSIIKISGLEANAEKGIELLEHILNNAKPDSSVYSNYIEKIISNRAFCKKDPHYIIDKAMLSYAQYGAKSDFTNEIPADELLRIKPDTMTAIAHNIENYPHNIFYYGQKNKSDVIHMLKKYHKEPASYKTIPKPISYTERELKSEVYFINFDMVQTIIKVMIKCGKYTPELTPMNSFFNEYYSGNMSSIIFQDIRELKGLAYSAYSTIETPKRSTESSYNISHVGTQFDKMQTATDEIIYLLNNLQKSDILFELSKNSLKKQIETSRITDSEIYREALKNKDLGIGYDIREKIYEKVQTLTFDEFADYFNSNISSKPKTILVIGNRDLIDLGALKKHGKVTELTIDQVFGY